MRDVILLALIFGSVPAIIMRPWIGVIVWSWISYTNPHRYTWGVAYDFPIALVVGAATLLATVFNTEKKVWRWDALTVCWVVFIIWMNVTTLFALNPVSAFNEWDRSMKIQLFSVLSVLLMGTRFRTMALVVAIVVSLGFHGIRGGLFAVATQGNYLVWGPAGSFIEDNNALALALIMILPLMYFLFTYAKQRWIKIVLIASMALTMLSVFSSHSRGALVATVFMLGYLWIKGKYKVWLGVGLLLSIPLLFYFMPEAWFERMATITNYSEDGSAMGRINAWHFAWNLALDHPIVGGGFQTFTPWLFAQYAPIPDDFHDSHSIYFEVLGEQGFVGLFLFLSLMALAWNGARRAIRLSKKRKEDAWIGQLAAMLQVSIVGYATGGAFQGLAYFDLYYHLIALVVLCNILLTKASTTVEGLVEEEISDKPRFQFKSFEPGVGLTPSKEKS